MSALLFALYFYAGITGTPHNAYHTEAAFRVSAKPNCGYNECHAVAWTILWDRGKTGQYVEAGVGYIPRFACDGTSLWVATLQVPGGEEVACVPLNEWVSIYIDKHEGESAATVWWFWQNNHIDRRVALPAWANGPGISPTKIEVYTTAVPPSPVHIEVYGASAQGSLETNATYPLVPGSTLHNFRVQVP